MLCRDPRLKKPLGPGHSCCRAHCFEVGLHRIRQVPVVVDITGLAIHAFLPSQRLNIDGLDVDELAGTVTAVGP